MKKLYKLGLSLIVIGFLLIQIDRAQAVPWDTPNTYTWWMRSDTHTVNTVLGYVANVSHTNTPTYITQTAWGNNQTWWSVRVYRITSTGSSIELTDGNNINVTRTGAGEGLQTVTWTPDVTSITVGGDALELDINIKIGADVYVKKAVFMTSHLKTDEIINSVWTFYLYTKWQYSAPNTIASFYWGDLTYQSRIQNVQLAKLTPWEEQKYFLRAQDFVQFIISPWTYHIGNAVWGVALLFVVGTTYFKYGDIRPVIVMVWLFAGTGGIITILIPVVSLPISWFMLAFALATTLYIAVR